MHKFCFKFLPAFHRNLMFYHALYSKAKTAGYVEGFYLKQLSIPDKYISDLGKRFHSSSGKLQYFLVSQCKWALQRAKFTAKQMNHWHSWNRSYLISCGSKTKVVQNGIFQGPLARFWITTIKEWCGALFENKSFCWTSQFKKAHPNILLFPARNFFVREFLAALKLVYTTQ